MAYVDKARVEGTLYDISPSPTGNLDSTSENAYTSSDVAQANVTTWTNVDPILNTEQHRSIFSKVTGMIKNIRYLYNLVGSGTFAPGNGTTITDVVNNKAPKSHSHTAAQLPTSNSQINSTSYVPTSALIYSMNQTLNSLNDAIEEIENNLSSQSEYDKNHSIVAIITSTSQADTFCNTYNHANGYNGLKLGQRIYIGDGTYNQLWYIAGFDCEYNTAAADGTLKSNGYGICLIPEIYVTEANWNNNGLYFINSFMPDVSSFSHTSYKQSTMHTSTLPTVANNLRNVLGNHLINRNVLLGSSVNLTYTPTSTNINGTNAYTWTTAYCTLLSPKQITGTYFSQKYKNGSDGSYSYTPQEYSSNKYDDGEANYKLPLFNYEKATTGTAYWTRAHAGIESFRPTDPDWDGTIRTSELVWYVFEYVINTNVAGRIYPNYNVWGDLMNPRKGAVRPMIYIR